MNETFMREAIRLSMETMRTGRGGPFGAIVARGGEIVGRGANEVTSRNDPTAHAEVLAIRQACERLGTFRLDDCELYTSCEPCPMCLAAIYWARLPRLYYANRRTDAAAIGFDDERLYQELALPIEKRALAMTQCLHQEALAAFQEWQHKPDKTPY